MKTLGELVARNARLHADDPFLVYEGRVWTHAQAFERANRLASALSGAGCNHQDRVAVLAMNCPEYLEIFAANWMAGFITATVNFRLGGPEIRDILLDCDPRILLFEAQYAGLVDELRGTLPGIARFICIGDAPDWATGYETFLASATGECTHALTHPEDTALLIYTSGTTGKPKGVMRSHRCELACGQGMMTIMDVRPRGRMLEVMPLFHAGAQSSSLAQMLRGGTIHLHRGFDPHAVLTAIEGNRLTHLHFVPTMVQALLDHPDFEGFDLSSVETLLYAGAPMPVPLLRRALARFGPVFVGSWGMSEGGGTFLPKHAHDPEAPRLLASVGQMQAYGAMRIVDDAGCDCPVGTPGEIWIRSEHQFSGYWNKPEATARAVVDGWLKTGDMGYFDALENVFLVDRRKDMIISGGENIYSVEVENALASHPAVAAVAVIGVPDRHWGEAVCAVIVPRAERTVDADAIIAHAAARIASYKKPRHVIVADSLPMMPTGKIDKKTLRALYAGVGTAG